MNGHVNVMNLLIEKGGNVHAIDANGCTMVYAAAQYDQPQAVDALILNGTNADKGNDRDVHRYGK